MGLVGSGSGTCTPRRINFRRHVTDDGAAADEGRRAFDGGGSIRVGSGTVDHGRSDPRVDDAGGPAPIDEHGGRRVHRRKADTCRPPAEVKAFQHFWSIASNYTSEREERKASVSAQNHADKSAGKLLEKSTSEAAHAPTHTASAGVYPDPATITALKQFAGTKKISNVDLVLATVPAAARAILMVKFDSDNGTVLTADGQEAKRGALFLVTEVLPRRAQRVLRTTPHCREMSFTDR